MKWGVQTGICSTKEAAEALRKMFSKLGATVKDDANSRDFFKGIFCIYAFLMLVLLHGGVL